MTAMAPLRDILNDTPADAVDVQWNFQNLEGFVNTELINRDGSVAMQQPLVLVSPPPTQPAHAANKAYVDASIPTGVIWEFAGVVAPAGWALCDGTSKSTTDPIYAALFAIIQYKFGGSGGNFNLPNSAGKVMVGFNAADALFNAIGKTGGSKDSIVPVHNHTATASQGTHNHTGGDHRHPMDHAHSASSGIEDVGHVHGTVGAGGAVYGHNNAGGYAHGGTGPNNWVDLSSVTTGNISANHRHPVTVNATSGQVTDWAGAVTTSTVSAGAIAVTVNNAGVAVANTNLPPFLTINHIIRL